MADNVYLRLREFLDYLPGGYPATKSGVEMRLLKKLFTPEQAEIELQLTTTPESPSTIAARLNMDEKENHAGTQKNMRLALDNQEKMN